MPSSQSTRALSSRERVVKAATALFAAKGFGGTSTRDVARKARVNEVTVYRLFKNKQELYVQVLDRKMGLKGPERLIPNLQLSEDPGRAFVLLAERLEEHFDPTFLRLLFFAALEKPELLRKRYRASLVSFYEVIARQIKEQIDAEILRDIDPALMGRALVGMIAYDRIVCGLCAGLELLEGSTDRATDVYTDIWLRGALAWEAPARQNRTERPLMQTEVLASKVDN